MSIYGHNLSINVLESNNDFDKAAYNFNKKYGKDILNITNQLINKYKLENDRINSDNISFKQIYRDQSKSEAEILSVKLGKYMDKIKSKDPFKSAKSLLDTVTKFTNELKSNLSKDYKYFEFRIDTYGISKDRINDSLEEAEENYDKDIKKYDDYGNMVFYSNEIYVLIQMSTEKMLTFSPTKEENDAANKPMIDKVMKNKKAMSIMCKAYDDAIRWISNPSTNINSDLLLSVVAVAHLASISNDKLSSIVSPKLDKFNKMLELKDGLSFCKSKLGSSVKLILDIKSGSGDYAVFAKNKLWYINAEHEECVALLSIPYETDKFTDYLYIEIDVVRGALKDYDFKKGYYLLSEAPAGKKPIF